MSEYRLALAANCIAFVLVCVGCGKTPPPSIVPAQGIVLLDGAPLPQAQVRLIPSIGYGAEYIAKGVTDAQGKFTLQCNGQPGACAVENTVLVVEADIPAQFQGENRQQELATYLRTLKNRPIPQNYGSLVSTPLKVVVSEGQAEIKLELKR